MKTYTSNNKAERAGMWLGRAWRGFVRQEARVTHWMTGNGVSPLITKAVLSIVKLAVVAALLYTVFWLALLIVLAAVGAWLARNSDVRVDETTSEWREGFSGFGLYNREGHRIDPHSFDDD